MITQIAVIALLVLFNGLLTMAEMAIVSVKKSRLEQRSAEGDNRAQVALDLISSPSEVLATFQVALTLIATLTGAFGGATIAAQIAPYFVDLPYLGPYHQQVSLSLVVIVLTYFTLVIGELVPKRLALAHAESIAIASALPLKLFKLLVSPAARILNYSSTYFIGLLGVPGESQPKVTEEEIKDLIEQGTQAGVLQVAEQDMLERVFKLADRRIQLLMTPRADVIWLNVNDSFQDNIQKVINSPHSFFPVCDGTIDKVLGVVSVRTFWLSSMRHEETNLRENISEVLFVPDYMSSLRVLNRFKESGKTIAIVLDEYGSFEGMVSLHDFIQAIVGELATSSGEMEPAIVTRGDGSWLVDGRLAVDELRDLIDVNELPGEENYQTLAGFIMSYTGKIPRIGDQFEWQDLRFEIVDMDKHRIDRVWISRKVIANDRIP